MSDAKLEHWVPQFYLRFFATRETAGTGREQVWAFSREEGDPFCTNVRNVAGQRFLTSPSRPDGSRDRSVDRQLQRLEVLLARVWKSLVSHEVSIGVEPIRRIIALFVATLFLRHPNRLDSVERTHRRLVEAFASLPADERGNPLLNGMWINSQFHRTDVSDWSEFQRAGREDHRRVFGTSIRQNATWIAEHLLRKRWSIVEAPNPVFVTSDNPVCVQHKGLKTFGIGTPDTVVSLPVSPRMILVLDDRVEQPNCGYYTLCESGAAPFNLATWTDTRLHMFSSCHPDAALAEIVNLVDEV